MTFRRTVGFVLIASLALPQTGCIGSFRLSGKVFDWNRGVGSLAVQEVLFLAFVILPVYEITFFIDAFILNVIEAFTGSNPLSDTQPVRDIELADGTVLRMERLGEHDLRTTLLVDGQAPQTREFAFREDGVDIRDGAGVAVASATLDMAGGLELVDASGAVVAAWSPGTVRDAEEGLMSGGSRGLAAVVAPAVGTSAVAAE